VTALDWRAVLLGAAAAVAIAVPTAVLNAAVVDDGEETNLVFGTLLLVLAGFAVGGFVAARRAPDGPLANGAVAALCAFLVVQGAGVVRRLAADEPLSLPSLAFAALLAYSSGLLGALAASRRGGRVGA
jgi:putative membrane protein (TIGR04086 family)